MKVETVQKLRDSGVFWVKTTFRKRPGRWEMAKLKFSSKEVSPLLRAKITESLRSDFVRFVSQISHERMSFMTFIIKADGYIALFENETKSEDKVEISDPALIAQPQAVIDTLMERIDPDDEVCVMRPSLLQDAPRVQLWEGTLARRADLAVNLRAEVCSGEIVAAEVSVDRVYRSSDPDLRDSLAGMLGTFPKQFARTLMKEPTQETAVSEREIRLEFPPNAPISLFGKEIAIRVLEDAFPGVQEGVLDDISRRPALVFLFIDGEMSLTRVLRSDIAPREIENTEGRPDV